MAEVTSMKNGSWMVLCKFDLTRNNTGSITFRCTGQKPTFQLTYVFNSVGYWGSTFSANLQIVEKRLSNQDYPILVTALLDGFAIEMKQPSLGLWNEAKWTYSRLLECDSYQSSRNRNAHLTLILQFPQFASLLDNQIMVDVKFIIKDKEMAAHAAILASASPVMAAMFEPGKFKEGQSRTVEITDIEPEVFQQLLRYVYTGNAPLMQKDSVAEQLLIAANKYQIDKMKAECEDTLVGKIALDNAIRFLVTAHLYVAPKLKEASIQCLIKHRFEVWNRSEWDRLNKSYNDLFIEACRRMYKDNMEHHYNSNWA